MDWRCLCEVLIPPFWDLSLFAILQKASQNAARTAQAVESLPMLMPCVCMQDRRSLSRPQLRITIPRVPGAIKSRDACHPACHHSPYPEAQQEAHSRQRLRNILMSRRSTIFHGGMTERSTEGYLSLRPAIRFLYQESNGCPGLLSKVIASFFVALHEKNRKRRRSLLPH
jgi:hypothetical protein